jgi:hypothetical protein
MLENASQNNSCATVNKPTATNPRANLVIVVRLFFSETRYQSARDVNRERDNTCINADYFRTDLAVFKSTDDLTLILLEQLRIENIQRSRDCEISVVRINLT